MNSNPLIDITKIKKIVKSHISFVFLAIIRNGSD